MIARRPYPLKQSWQSVFDRVINMVSARFGYWSDGFNHLALLAAPPVQHYSNPVVMVRNGQEGVCGRVQEGLTGRESHYLARICRCSQSVMPVRV
jgi:hypothetical protein